MRVIYASSTLKQAVNMRKAPVAPVDPSVVSKVFILSSHQVVELVNRGLPGTSCSRVLWQAGVQLAFIGRNAVCYILLPLTSLENGP
jgi:hypothetical protein